MQRLQINFKKYTDWTCLKVFVRLICQSDTYESLSLVTGVNSPYATLAEKCQTALVLLQVATFRGAKQFLDLVRMGSNSLNIIPHLDNRFRLQLLGGVVRVSGELSDGLKFRQNPQFVQRQRQWDRKWDFRHPQQLLCLPFSLEYLRIFPISTSHTPRLLPVARPGLCPSGEKHNSPNLLKRTCG